tara:strand:+ start:89 stop:598 length:510 start_codon:yes stop_codon:yes gene_type:complete
MANSGVSIVDIIENHDKLVALVTMGQYHYISRDDIIDIFKEVLNNDVAKNVASYIAHPIHEYIETLCLNYQHDCGLSLTWTDTLGMGSYKLSDDYINKFGYEEYDNMRMYNIKIMNNEGKFKGYARPYLPVNNYDLKKDIMEVLKQNGIKTSMSWTKKKMINHYYKSIV